jgi:pyruvate carboxylase
MMGQPMGGFPEDLRQLVLKGKETIYVRPGELLPDEDFENIKKYLDKTYEMDADIKDCLSYSLYPKVFEDYLKYIKDNGDFKLMGSDIYFHGLEEGETCEVKIEEGKFLVIKLVEIRKVDEDGNRDVVFEINGNRRVINIKDHSAVTKSNGISKVFADKDSPNDIGANIPGTIIKVLVSKGDSIKANEPIAVVEAMKMETNILSPIDGEVTEMNVKEGQQVEAGELIAKVE